MRITGYAYNGKVHLVCRLSRKESTELGHGRNLPGILDRTAANARIREECHRAMTARDSHVCSVYASAAFGGFMVEQYTA